MDEIKKKKIMKGKTFPQNPYNISLTNIEEERIQAIIEMRKQGLSRSAISEKVKTKWSTVNNVFREIDRRNKERGVYDLVNQLMNNNFSLVKRKAAENIIRLLYEGDVSISKWIMEKGFKTVQIPEDEEVFGNDTKS